MPGSASYADLVSRVFGRYDPSASGEDGRADRGLLALRGVRVEIVLIHSPLALIPRALFRFFHAILELRGFAPVHAVAESAGLDLTPKRLGLAGRFARDPILLVRREHEARVLSRRERGGAGAVRSGGG